jgi:hypothetical protein
MVVLTPLALVGIARLRRDPVVCATLLAWTAAAAFGVRGGGTYWPHYLIQLAVPTAAGSAMAIRDAHPLVRRGLLAAAAVLVIAYSIGTTAQVVANPPHGPERRIGTFLRRHAQPGDTAYALYARANLAYYDQLPSPFPYAWSLMMRAKPGARAELGRLLASRRAPTWIVEWQHPWTWRLDTSHALRNTLHRRYRLVARIDDHPILHLR